MTLWLRRDFTHHANQCYQYHNVTRSTRWSIHEIHEIIRKVIEPINMMRSEVSRLVGVSCLYVDFNGFQGPHDLLSPVHAIAASRLDAGN